MIVRPVPHREGLVLPGDGDRVGPPSLPATASCPGSLPGAWAISCGDEHLPQLHPEARFYEEVRVWMAKFDAAERQARGEPLPDDIKRLLNQLVAESTASGEVLDIYDAAGMPRPTLTDLTPTFLARAQQASNPHLAIEALRAMLTEESTRATGGNVVRQRAFSERITELMRKYTNQQLTSAEVIAELIELAREVAAEGNRGARFSPPLGVDELAFFDAVAQNESAVAEQGEGVLAQIARELVGVMRRDVRTDWTVRDDVRAKLRSSIKRLLVKHGYPPDKQPTAIKLVLEQMESMAPGTRQTESERPRTCVVCSSWVVSHPSGRHNGIMRAWNSDRDSPSTMPCSRTSSPGTASAGSLSTGRSFVTTSVR